MTSAEVSGCKEDVKEPTFNLSLRHSGQTLRSQMTLEIVKDRLI